MTVAPSAFRSAVSEAGESSLVLRFIARPSVRRGKSVTQAAVFSIVRAPRIMLTTK